MKQISFIIFSAICILSFTSCSKDNDEENTTSPQTETKVAQIIFDTDLGNSTDDVFAMHAMFAYQAKGACKVVGIMQDRKHEKAKDLLDRFMHFYKADGVPLGLVEGESQFFEIIPYYQLVDSLKEDGTPLFEPTGIPLSERLTAWKLYRKLLSEADDNSISIVCTGFLTNLGLLIDSQPDEYSSLTGIELIQKKVRDLTVMGGCFSPVPLRFTTRGGTIAQYLEVEYNISGDVPLAKKVLQNWPGNICIFPLEEGMRFPSIHDRILQKYSWQKDSPIYQIYSRYDEWQKGDVGQYLWDLFAMLHPILGGDYFADSPRGNVVIDDNGHTDFVKDVNGKAIVIGTSPAKYTYMWTLSDDLASYHP